MLQFCEWLAGTAGSAALIGSAWAYAVIESVHVLGLVLFLGLTVLLDLRLTGISLRHIRVSELGDRLLPWIVTGFVLMVVSGGLLFYAIPVRSYQNIFFRVKVMMLLLAGCNVWMFHAGVGRRMADWDLDPVPPWRARAAGVVSLVLWFAIVISGRMIAYNWFECGLRVQPAIVSVLSGCTADQILQAQQQSAP